MTAVPFYRLVAEHFRFVEGNFGQATGRSATDLIPHLACRIVRLIRAWSAAMVWRCGGTTRNFFKYNSFLKVYRSPSTLPQPHILSGGKGMGPSI